ncbi:MAG: oxidoreductase [Gemmataceae bacterium]
MTRRPTRREFLGKTTTAALGLTVPLFVPATALGTGQRTAASDRITLGFIGTGGRGRGLINMFLAEKDTQILAVCDVDQRHLHQAQELVNKRYGTKDCAVYKDFRQLVARPDIDAVVVATPDHWHALTSIAAARARKDIYCEKPLTNSIGEGRALCKAVQENGRILQTGSHERSNPKGRFACEIVRSGLIGKVHTLRVHLPCDEDHHKQARALRGMPPTEPVPDGFDYDFWLGPAPQAPYTSKRCHFWWRFVLAYGGGEMTDRGAHVMDLGLLGAGLEDTGPVEIEARGVCNADSLYDVFWDYEFVNTFANGVKLIGSTQQPRGVKFEGTEGWVFIHVHGCKLEAEPASLLKVNPEKLQVQLGRTPNHVRNFLDAVKSRKQPFAPAEAGHRTASLCHLNNIAMRVGRKLRWDPVREQFVGDDEANAYVTPKMRAPWSL